MLQVPHPTRTGALEPVGRKARVEPGDAVGSDQHIEVLGGPRVAVVDDRHAPDNLEVDAAVVEQAPHLAERGVDGGKLGAHGAREGAKPRQGIRRGPQASR